MFAAASDGISSAPVGRDGSVEVILSKVIAYHLFVDERRRILMFWVHYNMHICHYPWSFKTVNKLKLNDFIFSFTVDSRNEIIYYASIHKIVSMSYEGAHRRDVVQTKHTARWTSFDTDQQQLFYCHKYDIIKWSVKTRKKTIVTTTKMDSMPFVYFQNNLYFFHTSNDKAS